MVYSKLFLLICLLLCRFGLTLLAKTSHLSEEERARALKGLFQGCCELFDFITERQDTSQVRHCLSLRIMH